MGWLALIFLGLSYRFQTMGKRILMFVCLTAGTYFEGFGLIAALVSKPLIELAGLVSI